jgi:hypothetical protein
MKKLLHVNLLLLVAVALFVLEGTQVKCGVIIGKVAVTKF